MGENCNVRENARETGSGNGPDQEPNCGQRGWERPKPRRAKKKGRKKTSAKCGMRQSTVAAGADGGGIGKERQHCTNNNNGEGRKINEKNNNELTAGTSQRRRQEKAEIVRGTPSPTMALEWHLGVSGSGSQLRLPCLKLCLRLPSYLVFPARNVPLCQPSASLFPLCPVAVHIRRSASRSASLRLRFAGFADSPPFSSLVRLASWLPLSFLFSRK